MRKKADVAILCQLKQEQEANVVFVVKSVCDNIASTGRCWVRASCHKAESAVKK